MLNADDLIGIGCGDPESRDTTVTIKCYANIFVLNVMIVPKKMKRKMIEEHNIDYILLENFIQLLLML